MHTIKLSHHSKILIAAIIIVLLSSFTLSAAPPAIASTREASYIVQATSSTLAAQLVEKNGGIVTSHLDIINAVGATLSDEVAAKLRLETGILAITPNGAVNMSDKSGGGGNDKDKDKDKNHLVPSTDYPEVVGADVVWEQGFIGSDVTVAVLDTGLGDIPGLIKGVKNKSSRVVAWKDFVDNNKKPVDPNGHGSHVAGIIANSQKDDDGEWNGIAPGVNLVGVRVLNAEGYGTYEKVILGLQWVIKNKARYNIQIVNLSLVAPVESPYWADPLNQAVTQAWANGLTVIVAAGNDGPGAMSVTVPGNNPYVITVGAFTDNFTPDNWDDDYIPSFSGAGPTLDGFVKPDLVAPGAHMVSVIPQGSLLASQYPANQLVGSYFKLAGTSQATATVSGVAALVLSKNPDLTPDEVKQRLTGTALSWVDVTTTDALYSMWQQGTGRVNAPDAVLADISGSANIGMDIQADLAGTIHYEGYSYFDDVTGTFRLYDPYADWGGGYGTWDGNYYAAVGGKGTWLGGKGAWLGTTAWASGKGAWLGGKGAWLGSTTWASGKGAWLGGKGAWLGGYTAWAGGKGAWLGSEPWTASLLSDPAFVANFSAGESPNMGISKAMISFFLQDP